MKKKIWTVLTGVLLLGLLAGLYADSMKDEIIKNIKKKTGKVLKESDLVQWQYGGIYFYFHKNTKPSHLKEMKQLAQSTVNIMKKEVTNSLRWREYARYGYFLDDQIKASGGGYAPRKQEMIYAYYKKLRTSKGGFSPVIPHELCHKLYHLHEDLRPTVESLRKKYIRAGIIKEYDSSGKGEQENQDEFFCNISEAYIYWSNESFPVTRDDLKQKMPEAYAIMKKFYSR
jgi:hypothetical protein